MLVQAAGLAVLAAVSPTALLLAAVYLGSARPRTTLLLYLSRGRADEPRDGHRRPGRAARVARLIAAPSPYTTFLAASWYSRPG